MADGMGMGPDILLRNMFLHEAQQSPTSQELATMTAPFGGSPQQALAFMQSPAMQKELGNYGIHFDPSQVRQSPFFPNAFMGGHPGVGGALTGAFANAAATPEAPLVSGAGSGISRAAQGFLGGPELLRQYQVRQLMAPFQAMGMQLPVRAEERRQQLLQSIQEDMARRGKLEEQIQPELAESRRLKEEAELAQKQAALTTAEANMQKANTPKYLPGMGFLYPGGGLQTTQPAGMPAELGGQISQGGPHFEPLPQASIDQYVKTQQAIHPERQSAADWKKALIDEGVPEKEAEYYAARAVEARGKGAEAASKAAGGGSMKYDQKGMERVEDEKKKAYGKLEEYIRYYNSPHDPNGKLDDKQWEAQRQEWLKTVPQQKQQIEDDYAYALRTAGGRTGDAYQYPGGPKSTVPHQNPFITPQAAPGGGAPTTSAPGGGGLPPGYQFNEQGIPVPIVSAPQTQ